MADVDWVRVYKRSEYVYNGDFESWHSPSTPFPWSDPEAVIHPQRFYRTRLGP